MSDPANRSFIKFDDSHKSVGEYKTAAIGEYDLTIVSVELHSNRQDARKKSVHCQIQIGSGDYRRIDHYCALPNPEIDTANDREKGNEPGTSSKTKVRMLKRFMYLIKAPWSDEGFDFTAWQGKQFRARVDVEEDNRGGIRNLLVVPPMPEDVT